MIFKEEINKLADLARIEIKEEEQEKLASEMEAVLDYIGQIKSVTGGEISFSSPEQRGVMVGFLM